MNQHHLGLLLTLALLLLVGVHARPQSSVFPLPYTSEPADLIKRQSLSWVKQTEYSGTTFFDG